MDNGILSSIQIMFIGMAFVILFLIILVYIMKFVGVIVAQIDKIMPQQEESILSTPAQNINKDKMTAIAIALAHIHSDKKNNN